MVGEADEGVGCGVVGDQLLVGDRPGDLHRVEQIRALPANRSTAVRYSSLMASAHQVQSGQGVVEAPVGGERLDQVVLALVGRDLPDEQQVGPTPASFSSQTVSQDGIG